MKRFELHADYLAGYYAGVRKLKKPAYPAAVFATQTHFVGDLNVNNPLHHGTPDERAAAIVRGFEVAYREKLGLSEAVWNGNMNPLPWCWFPVASFLRRFKDRLEASLLRPT
jgi:hypothetical protein